MINEKIKRAIEVLKEYEPQEGYLLGFSGGKDSIVIHDLAKRSGVKFEAIHNYTTVDMQLVIKFIRENYKNVKIVYPERTMFQLIAEKGIMTRICRLCCTQLKENYGWGRTWIIGVRWAESSNRKQNSTMFQYNLKSKQRDVEQDKCEKLYANAKAKKIINIIIDWTDKDVWDYIHKNNLKYPEVYDNGQHRVGCIGCPMGSKKQMEQQFIDFPNVKKAYLWAFKKFRDKCILEGRDNIATRMPSSEVLFEWWLSKLSEKKFNEKRKLI